MSATPSGEVSTKRRYMAPSHAVMTLLRQHQGRCLRKACDVCYRLLPLAIRMKIRRGLSPSPHADHPRLGGRCPGLGPEMFQYGLYRLSIVTNGQDVATCCKCMPDAFNDSPK